MTRNHLLRMAPATALRRIVASSLHDMRDIDKLTIGRPIAVDDDSSLTLTKVLLKPNPLVATRSQIKEMGTTEFEYHRINIQTLLEGVTLVYPHSLPAVMSELILHIERMTGIVFDSNDIMETTIDEYGLVTVTANPLSYRWVGQATIMLVER